MPLISAADFLRSWWNNKLQVSRRQICWSPKESDWRSRKWDEWYNVGCCCLGEKASKVGEPRRVGSAGCDAGPGQGFWLASAGHFVSWNHWTAQADGTWKVIWSHLSWESEPRLSTILSSPISKTSGDWDAPKSLGRLRQWEIIPTVKNFLSHMEINAAVYLPFQHAAVPALVLVCPLSVLSAAVTGCQKLLVGVDLAVPKGKAAPAWWWVRKGAPAAWILSALDKKRALPAAKVD